MTSIARISPSRLFLALLLALSLGFSTTALVGCGDDDSQQSTASQADDEQDNCYGDDLPAKKS